MHGLQDIPMLNLFYTLQCSVIWDEELNDRVVFTRGKGDSAFAAFAQHGDDCSIYKKPPSVGYELICDLGTDKAVAVVKYYLLHMKVTLADITEWSCHLNRKRIFSNVFTVRT